MLCLRPIRTYRKVDKKYQETKKKKLPRVGQGPLVQPYTLTYFLWMFDSKTEKNLNVWFSELWMFDRIILTMLQRQVVKISLIVILKFHLFNVVPTWKNSKVHVANTCRS